MEEMVGDDKLSHKGLNGGRNEFHGPSLAAPSKKAATMTVFLISILLLIGAFIVTRWGNSNVVSSSALQHMYFFLHES